MLLRRFARHLLEQNWTAIAIEFVLLVVGVFLGIQVANWNEGRIAQQELREYALNLSAAIKQDMAMLDPVEMQIRASIRQAGLLSDYLRDRTVEQMENAELFFLTTHTGYRPYGWSRAAMEQIKAAGGLRQMRNQVLADRISDYDALAQHLDQDYREDEQSARAMQELQNRLIDGNYPPDGLAEVVGWDDGFTEADIDRRLTRFRETPAFARLSALDRPLLSNSLAEFRLLANLSADYAVNTAARPEIELPRLRKFAAEIQVMIEDEYR